VRKGMDIQGFAEPEGLLEHLNLPPKLITFIRLNQKKIWLVIGCIICVVVAVSLYGSYRSYHYNKAASALDYALLSTTDKESLLQGVIDEYGTTPSALWAKRELAQIYEEQKEYGKAEALLAEILSGLPNSSFIKPLVTYNLAVMKEKQGALDDAAGEYTVLAEMEGFAAISYKALGRIKEEQGKAEQAIGMYKTPDGASVSDPAKEVIEARIRFLGEQGES